MAKNQADNLTVITAELTTQEVAALRKIAKDMGYLIGRGPLYKEGSIRKLLRATAEGVVAMRKVPTIASVS